MSQSARRVYYLSAFLVFAVVGPLIVAWTAGYRWSNIRIGFVQTGSLTVLSEPRASISINGTPVGMTPFRATHLPAGTYVLELSKEGYGRWRQEISMAKKTALTVGPVNLFAAQFNTSSVAQTTDIFLSTNDLKTTFEIVPIGQAWRATQIWPQSTSPSILLQFKPTSVLISRTGQTSIWQDGSQTVIIQKNKPAQPWIVVSIDNIRFDPASEGIFYGRKLNTIFRYDTLTKQITPLASGTSLTLDHDRLWMTQPHADQTTIARQPTFGSSVPDTVLTLPGTWVFVSSPIEVLLIRNTTTKELVMLNQLFATSQLTSSSLGPADQWWWYEVNKPPLWLNGSDLMTLDNKNKPKLIDRLSITPHHVAWVIPSHIVWSTSEKRMRIDSVSSRQGRGTLLEQTYDQPTKLIGLNIAERSALIKNSNSPAALTEVEW